MTKAQPQGGMLDEDSDAYWKHNELQVLRMMFEGAAYHLRAREDPEVFEQIKIDAQRLKALELRYAITNGQATSPRWEI